MGKNSKFSMLSGRLPLHSHFSVTHDDTFEPSTRSKCGPYSGHVAKKLDTEVVDRYTSGAFYGFGSLEYKGRRENSTTRQSQGEQNRGTSSSFVSKNFF